MSSVVIAGDTSGSVTLQAPSVAGTTTLTLPSTSGTVTTKDSNGILSVNGVQFPATQSASADANCLDDYEEGTWTPVLQGTSTAGTYTYDTTRTNGKYIKIGKMVSVFGVYRIDTVTSAGTGVAKITGLPFTAAALDTAWDRFPGMLRVQSGPTLANNGYFCYTENPGTFLGIGIQGVADWTEVSVTDADAVGAVWFFQCTYEAA